MTAALEYPELAARAALCPVVAVQTVTGRWVPCVLTDLGVQEGLRSYRAEPVERDLTRAELVLLAHDVPQWSPPILLILHVPGEHGADCPRGIPAAPVNDGRPAVAPADRPDDPTHS